MTKRAELESYVFDHKPHLLSAALLQWMEASPRFTAFVETYRDKIRKKVRVTRQPESVFDLRGELEVAYRLLDDRRLEVAYELYASAKRRGPDFAVTYRANLVFNVEAARLRAEQGEEDGLDLGRKDERLLRILLDKLGQMQPGMPNLLVIQAPDELVRSTSLDRLMQQVKTRVEGKDPSFYAAARYAGPAAFYKDFLHLSGILLWAPRPVERPEPVQHAAAQPAVQSWANKQARPVLPENILRLAVALLSGAEQASTH